jgi:hypothetical protein
LRQSPSNIVAKADGSRSRTRKCRLHLGFSRCGDQSHPPESFSNIDTGCGLRHVIAAFDRNMITVLSEMTHV